MNESGLQSRIAAIKDILTPEHRAGRLHFARRYVDYPIEFWRWVLFTDEKSWSWAAHGQIRVRRHQKERFEKKNIYSIKISGRTTVSVRGGVWLGGLTLLYCVQNNLNSAQYITNVLEGTLLPYILQAYPHGETVVFVQDKYL